MGAHLAGYTGYHLQQCGHQLGRITGRFTLNPTPSYSRNKSQVGIVGLDPADPYFQNTESMIRLDSGDAQFVDVIHTNSGPFLSGGASILIININQIVIVSL